MTDYSAIKTTLLHKQKELSDRLQADQAPEEPKDELGLDESAQRWEASEIKNGLDDEAVQELNQVNEALARLDAGEYGYCKSCGNQIGSARLEAMPFATLCIDCAESSEDNADLEAFDPNEY